MGARLAARAVELVGTRRALAAGELRVARPQLVASRVLLAVALGAPLVALIFATLGVIAYFWDTHRYGAITLVTLAYAIAAVVALWRARVLRDAAPPLLGASIDELRRDARRLDPRDGTQS